LLHGNIVFTQYSFTQYSHVTQTILLTKASIQQVTETDWLTRPCDNRCAVAFKTWLPSFVPVTLEFYNSTTEKRKLFYYG
jgi:hypothetical protein